MFFAFDSVEEGSEVVKYLCVLGRFEASLELILSCLILTKTRESRVFLFSRSPLLVMWKCVLKWAKSVC